MDSTATTTQTATSARIDRLRARIEELKVDALLVSSAHNRRYLSGFTGSNGWLLISRDHALLATDFRYWEQSAAQAPEFTLYQGVGPMERWFADFVEQAAPARLGFEAADLSYAAFRQIRSLLAALPEAARPDLVPLTGVVEGLRAVKDPGEIAAMERVIGLADAAFIVVAARIEPGWTERRIAWEVEKAIRERDGDGISFSTIVATGPWGAMPHAYPRDHSVSEGEPLVIDMGALLDGYCSDMTRTITLGTPDARFNAIYDIVLTAQLTAIEMVEAGMKGSQVHDIAHEVIRAAGYGEQFGHGLGHGIGLQVHEAPRVVAFSDDVLEDGMIFSIEPGIYISGWGGVRIEDLVVLENGKARVLTKSPKTSSR